VELTPDLTEPGWVTWIDGPPHAHIRVRARSAVDGRVEVAELRIEHPDGVSSDLLRAIPLGRLEAGLNSPELRDALASLPTVTTSPGSDPSEFHELHRSSAAPTSGQPSATARDAVLAAHDPETSVASFHTRPDQPRDLRLERTGDRKHPDEFYAEVADLYSWTASRSRRPAADIAAANDVPVTTAHRWVKECRRRGLLPAGRRGQAG
jgi:hypothetical protein